MNLKITMLILALLIAPFSVFAQTVKKDTIKVYGNCGMCKERIQKALKIEGISAASWDVQTKMLTLTFDAGRISSDAIQKLIAAAGHDTEKYTAADEVYERLPGCCKYARKNNKSKNNKPKK